MDYSYGTEDCSKSASTTRWNTWWKIQLQVVLISFWSRNCYVYERVQLGLELVAWLQLQHRGLTDRVLYWTLDNRSVQRPQEAVGRHLPLADSGQLRSVTTSLQPNSCRITRETWHSHDNFAQRNLCLNNCQSWKSLVLTMSQNQTNAKSFVLTMSQNQMNANRKKVRASVEVAILCFISRDSPLSCYLYFHMIPYSRKAPKAIDTAVDQDYEAGDYAAGFPPFFRCFRLLDRCCYVLQWASLS